MLERFLSWVLGLDKVIAEEKRTVLSERLRSAMNAVAPEALRYSLQVMSKGAR